mmetsp:Transcript_3397/g.21238  ORF Transcript_3397/g.21238 Transcript_3397/m.21238 type:complete len:313 (-) Transcript_3397:70-1008(-)
MQSPHNESYEPSFPSGFIKLIPSPPQDAGGNLAGGGFLVKTANWKVIFFFATLLHPFVHSPGFPVGHAQRSINGIEKWLFVQQTEVIDVLEIRDEFHAFLPSSDLHDIPRAGYVREIRVDQDYGPLSRLLIHRLQQGQQSCSLHILRTEDDKDIVIVFHLVFPDGAKPHETIFHKSFFPLHLLHDLSHAREGQRKPLKHAFSKRLLHTQLDPFPILCDGGSEITCHLQQGSHPVDVRLCVHFGKHAAHHGPPGAVFDGFQRGVSNVGVKMLSDVPGMRRGVQERRDGASVEPRSRRWTRRRRGGGPKDPWSA